MKMTLLALVQSIASSLGTDEVNSYSDTSESQQIAEIVRTTYYNILTRADLPELKQLFQLTASTDATLPILMYRPDNVVKVDWLKYYNINSDNATETEFVHDLDLDITVDVENIPSAPSYGWVEILPVEEFLNMINQYNPNETDIASYNFNDGDNTFSLLYKNDKVPQYCTVIKNYYFLFDSYDSSVDSTLQSSKTQGYGQTIPTFTMADTFIPVLDDYQFPLLLNEAKSLAFLELKQMQHAKADLESRRQWGTLQKTKSLADKPSYFNQLPNYGRNYARF